MRNIDRTTEYAKLIIAGKKICGKSEYLACKRHLDDMQRGKDFPYVFDAKIAERYIEIASNLTIAEGEEANPLKLRGFQCFIIGSLFGWRKKRSNLRRFREAYAQISRQNGKSILAAVLALLESGFSGYRYGRILCAATKQEQADIVYDEIVKLLAISIYRSATLTSKTYGKSLPRCISSRWRLQARYSLLPQIFFPATMSLA